METAKINELMIGNYLSQTSENPEIIIVDAIDSAEGLVCGNGIQNIKIEELSPIILNENWLLLFGFKKSEKPFGKTYFFANTHNDWKLVLKNGLIKRNGKTIKYVHQLQNLYFALTENKL